MYIIHLLYISIHIMFRNRDTDNNNGNHGGGGSNSEAQLLLIYKQRDKLLANHGRENKNKRP
jgi:hypothetical protein